MRPTLAPTRTCFVLLALSITYFIRKKAAGHWRRPPQQRGISHHIQCACQGVLLSLLSDDVAQGSASLSPIEALQGIFGVGITVTKELPFFDPLDCSAFIIDVHVPVRRLQHDSKVLPVRLTVADSRPPPPLDPALPSLATPTRTPLVTLQRPLGLVHTILSLA